MALLPPRSADALPPATAPTPLLVEEPELCRYRERQREHWDATLCGLAFDAISEGQKSRHRSHHE